MAIPWTFYLIFVQKSLSRKSNISKLSLISVPRFTPDFNISKLSPDEYK